MGAITKGISEMLRKGLKHDYAKKSSKLATGKKEVMSGKAKAEMPAKPGKGSIAEAKMIASGVDKASKRVKRLKASRKPGMSKGYKTRKGLKEELSNTKRQMMKQGHSKELAQKIADLQQKIDDSYRKK